MGKGLLTFCACVGFQLLGSRALSASGPPLLRPERYELDLAVDFEAETIGGIARIQLVNPADAPVEEASLLLYRLMTVHDVRGEGGRRLPFRQQVVAFEDLPTWQVNHVLVPLPHPLKKGERVTLEVEYGGYLLGYAETGMRYIQDRVDPSLTIIREDANAYPTVRVPSIRANRAAGLPEFEYVARIRVPESHVVANGGELVERAVRNGTATYVYRSIKPSWRMDFAVARFGLLERGPLRIFHLQEDAAGAARLLGAMERCLALFGGWFGPLAGQRAFTVIELPDGWGSQTDVTSILQAAAAFRDPKRIVELYHEVSHLWNVPSTDNPPPRWDEGLASFLQVLAAERLDGTPKLEDRVEATAAQLRGRLAKDKALERVPLRDYGRETMTNHSYTVGMLLFYVLHEAAGDEAFRATIVGFRRAYGATGGTTEDFVRVAKSASPVPLDRLFQDWLYTTNWSGIVKQGLPIREVAAAYRAGARAEGKSP